MPALRRTPGRHVTRRLREPDPDLLQPPKNPPGRAAAELADRHNRAVRLCGSNSGGWHAFDPEAMITADICDGPPFPRGSVVSDLAWGEIDGELAQRLLEMDGAA